MISKKAKIHSTAVIGHFVFIEDGVEIGAGSVVKNFVEIRKGVKIGNNCIIQSHCLIDTGAVLHNKTGVEEYSHVKKAIGPGIYGGNPLEKRPFKIDYAQIVNPFC